MNEHRPHRTPPSPPGARETVLEVENLRTYFEVEGEIAKAVDGVSFEIYADEVFGLVGESGCGKSVTALSVMRLIPSPPGTIAGGQIRYRGRDLLALPIREMRRIRGDRIAMIFQEPMTALDPVFTIGYQVREAILVHRPALDRQTAEEHAAQMLERVGIADARRQLGSYPHQISGGMRQRVMIAMALAMEPDLLIADEPTTALDVTIQAQILELMLELRKRAGTRGAVRGTSPRGARRDAASSTRRASRLEPDAEQDAGTARGAGASMLLITHDLAVVAETCDRVAVMYGGELQEIAEVRPLFQRPLHPYTQGLLASLPRPDRPRRQRLDAIPGSVPSILELPSGCKFVTRCPARIPLCEEVDPQLVEVESGRFCRCHVTERRLAAGWGPPRAFPWDEGEVDVAVPGGEDPRAPTPAPASHPEAPR
ncbi:MAG TPA: ABC transporter ATP-binding protein [Thermoanaerobaculia bacterium]|nr:ABC transporter ATP-binding protein [Thermoanaerobaculia bacterium]